MHALSESSDELLKRELKRLVLAAGQQNVANHLGIKPKNIACALAPGSRAQLASVMRIAHAVGCDLTLAPRHSEPST